MDSLDPRSLEVFLAVMETGSAALAAERLSLTQPTVARAIADLEAGAGLTLFERSRHGMRPTAEAALLAEEVRGSFAGLDRIALAAEAIRQGMKGSLVIGASPLYTDGILARAAGALSLEAPELSITVVTLDPEEIRRRMARDTLDLALLMGPLAAEAQLAVQPLGRRRMMAIMRRDHPLAGRSEIEVADLVDVDMVMLLPPSPWRTLVLQAFARQAAPVRSRLECLTQRGAAVAALTAGMVTLIDQELAEELAFDDRSVHIAPFTAVPPWELIAVHPHDRPLSRAGAAIVHRLRLAAADFNPPAEG